ncbi:uncharacterized protein LOC111321750 isoform X2 [Stylophora pistillata]|uniref:EGF-like domain-containing protein n=1 Tax=Stylophora pistillata TaxID=50429 RepID=A0A2B4STA3_STYPI|nr:uncharacterized protein LOC111321750 isoform X2 [Stylophora pistillata]PFX31818.1 hypothetical protein AWC38_SpisGene3374 [Stylophora pistillata]
MFLVYFQFYYSLLIIWSDLILEAACSQGVHDIYSPPQTVRQHVFVREEFRYLNVSRIGTYTVDDSFECTFRCLSHSSCYSVNLASSRGIEGKFWCELLSSDKNRNSTEYRGNKNSHHFVIKSPCSSSPCQNEGTCAPSYKNGMFECLCKKGFSGEFCEKAFESCKDVTNFYKSKASQLVTLYFRNWKTVSVLCRMGDFGCGDGTWTPVMKIDGNKNTFPYNSGYWTDKSEYNPSGGTTGFDSQETKLPTYWNTPFSKICLGMKVSGQLKFTVINKQASSLHSLIADGHYRATSLGRNRWIALTGRAGSSHGLQPNCNKEGFNAPTTHRRARIGILGNNENDCRTCDSGIGIGVEGRVCGSVSSFGAMCYILVQ